MNMASNLQDSLAQSLDGGVPLLENKEEGKRPPPRNGTNKAPASDSSTASEFEDDEDGAEEREVAGGGGGGGGGGAKGEEALEAKKSLDLSVFVTNYEIDPNDIKLGELLGSGSYGKVYKGKLYAKDVAVKKLNTKFLDEKALRAFGQEVDIMWYLFGLFFVLLSVPPLSQLFHIGRLGTHPVSAICGIRTWSFSWGHAPRLATSPSSLS